MRDRHIRRLRFDRQRLPDVEHGERHVVVVAAEIAHRAVAEIPPAVPARAGKIRLVERPRRRGAEPQIEVLGRRDRHLLLEPVDDLDAVVEAVRLVELLGRRRVLQPPRAIGPDVHFAHRTDHAGLEDLLDRAPCRRRVALVAHLRRQLRILRGRLTNEPCFPDVVGERLLAVDVLAVRQREVGRERVRVLGGRDHDGVEIVRPVEDAPEIGELLRLREPLRRRVERVLVHVAENGDVLVGMRRRGRGASPRPAVARAAPRPD